MLKSYIHKFNALFISFVTVQGKTYPLSNKTDRMAGKGHFHALQNQEKRSIRAPETHKNPQECAYLQPIFQKYAKRHARKNRISCGKRGSACRKDEKCLPQGRKTPAARTENACRKVSSSSPERYLQEHYRTHLLYPSPLPPRFPFRQNDTKTAFFPTRPGTPSARPPRRSGRMSAKTPKRLTLRLPSAPRESRIRTRLPTRTRIRDSPRACA